MPTLPPIEDSAPIESGRKSNRKTLFLTATLVSKQRSDHVRIRNLSETGALLESSLLPATGSTVSLCRGSIEIRGQLVWHVGQHGGMAFEIPINLADWLPHPNKRRAVRPAAIPSRALPRDTTPEIVRPDQNRADAPGSLATLAAQAESIALKLKYLGDEASTPATLEHHRAKLQDLEISIKALGQATRLLIAGTRTDSR